MGIPDNITPPNHCGGDCVGEVDMFSGADALPRNYLNDLGSVGETFDAFSFADALAHNEMDEAGLGDGALQAPATLPNNWVGRIPDDIKFFDFTDMEEYYRVATFGRGDWLIPTPDEALSVDDIGALAKESWDTERTYREFPPMIDESTHCSLLNWISQFDRGISNMKET